MDAGGTEAPQGGGGKEEHGLLLVFAFMIGFFPDWGLSLLRQFTSEKARQILAVAKDNRVEEPTPLVAIEGINVYHQSRLVDEGIENVENLAHADIIELMLETRIPLPTLVDWLDQAILLIHVKAEEDKKTLRSHGIRTATDLERTHEKADQRGQAGEFLKLLDPTEGPGSVPRFQSVLDAMRDDKWMSHLRRCRAAHVQGLFLFEPFLEWWDQGDDFLAEVSEVRFDA